MSDNLAHNSDNSFQSRIENNLEDQVSYLAFLCGLILLYSFLFLESKNSADEEPLSPRQHASAWMRPSPLSARMTLT
jgi:hypothetical protein